MAKTKVKVHIMLSTRENGYCNGSNGHRIQMGHIWVVHGLGQPTG